MPPPSLVEFEADCGEGFVNSGSESESECGEGFVNSGSESESESGSESGPCGGPVFASPAFGGHRRFRDDGARAAVCGGLGPLAGGASLSPQLGGVLSLSPQLGVWGALHGELASPDSPGRFAMAANSPASSPEPSPDRPAMSVCDPASSSFDLNAASLSFGLSGPFSGLAADAGSLDSSVPWPSSSCGLGGLPALGDVLELEEMELGQMSGSQVRDELRRFGMPPQRLSESTLQESIQVRQISEIFGVIRSTSAGTCHCSHKKYYPNCY